LKRWIYFPVAVFGSTATTFDPARIFQTPIFCLTCSFSASSRPSVLASGGQHHESFRLQQAFLIGFRHHGGLQHGGMRDQRALDLERRYPDARHLEHVVAAAAEV